MDSNIPNSRSKSIEDRLRILEDREEIRQLLIEYGRALDQRDFADLSKLFSEDAEYIGGGSLSATKGPAAIAKFVEQVFRKNPMGLRFPNFHLFANVAIQIDGDEAHVKSKGFFLVPNEEDMPLVVMMATNNDVLVRDKGRWKFKRRIVHMEIPAPAPSV